MKTNKGMVYLVGAGPGDPDLITVKGKKILERCDVVVYDALVNDLLVMQLPDTIQRIFVGKRGGLPSPKQGEINSILVREASHGKTVVRLKGGDPLVFGRGSEEMEYLAVRNIRYHVIPGVTSAIAAPAYSGIPLTHRNLSRSFAVATGHLMEGVSAEDLQLPDADTLVFLMGIENLPLLVEKLLKAGKFTINTPAALIRNGSLPDQKTVTGTLGTIVGLRDSHAIRPPAIFIVGETVRFSKTLSWFKRPPLANIRVAILRTNKQSQSLIEQLSLLGATVLPCPLIRIVPRALNLAKITNLYLHQFTMIIFTSPNGAAFFMEQLLNHGYDARTLSGKKVYTIGSGTSAILRNYGILTDDLPSKFVAEELVDLLPSNLSNENILIPRAAVAREILPESLRKKGAQVTVLPVYDTVTTESDGYVFNDGDHVLFTSSSTVNHFYAVPERRKLAIVPICIGDITAAELRKYFTGEISIADNATIDALVNALVRCVKRNKKRGSGESNRT